MITQFEIDNRTFKTKTHKKSDENIFTIIVGKNGTGKSRLLKSLVEEFIDPIKIERTSFSERVKSTENPIRIQRDYNPSSVIAISTSPFDKFPLPDLSRFRPDDLIENTYPNYEYLGLRGLYNKNLSISFMNRTINSLIESILDNEDHSKKICDVLEYLGYHRCIDIRFQFAGSISKIREILVSTSSLHAVAQYLNRKRDGFRLAAFDEDFDAINHEEIIRYFINLTHSVNKQRLDISINQIGIHNQLNNLLIDRNFAFLLRLGFLRIRDVTLQKREPNSIVNLNEASSGEQSIVLSFLGIASHISNESFICIDEPEICLHPEWQERYIQLLISTFRNFKRCHFFIATHSPQIISRLEDENCFVLNIETAKTADAKSLIKKSSDFQLATTFGAPGYKNEYLSRELLTLLTQFSKSGKFSVEQITFARNLLELKPTLDETDPVSKLMTMLEEVLSESSK